MNGQYDDIIHLPHPDSPKHPRMSLYDRAAQFSPFAALTGHSAAIAETGRLTDQRMELDEYEMARGEMCFDVVNCRYVNIKSYDRYRKIVMKSREYKDARIEAAAKRNEAKEESEAPDEDEEDDDVETGSLRDSIDKIWKKKR